LITTAAFVAIANSSTTVVVGSTTYYHYNPWYRRALYEGEEVYVLSSAPVGYETDQLPAGAETVEVEGATYHYAEGTFYQKANGGGYRVVEAPVGAEVSSIPKESISQEESEITLYQFDKTSFTKHVKDGGGEVYRVEPQPPAEEMDSMPADAPTFVADGETYYYVNYNLYVQYKEGGRTGFVNGEPEIGAQVDALPKGVTTIEENGKTYYQFDMVFFEEVQDENGKPFYEVVGSPDGSDSVELPS
jgi:hypothetical protein